jgi:hypothetical protein
MKNLHYICLKFALTSDTHQEPLQWHKKSICVYNHQTTSQRVCSNLLGVVSRNQFDCINEVIRVNTTQSVTADYWQVPNTFNASNIK